MDPEAIRDVFQGLGRPLNIRRMFGGLGIYLDDVMFALEVRGELYLKTDSETAPFFEGLGSKPFAYASRDGRTVTTSYWLMPSAALEEPDEAARLAGLAVAAALRRKRAAPRGRRSGRSKA
ncbi:MAG: TfoX/Sxy family protein [Microvirga sp.]